MNRIYLIFLEDNTVKPKCRLLAISIKGLSILDETDVNCFIFTIIEYLILS
jgi:hypothetical protein